jgi:membrane protein
MLGGVVFMVLMLGLVAVLPAVAGSIDFGAPGWLIDIARWLVTAVIFASTLSLIYRFFPENPPPTFRWASLGAIIATLLFLVASGGYSLYISNFSSLSKTYGTLAGIVITLIWFYVLSFAVLLGAQINVEVAGRSITAQRAAEQAQHARSAQTPAEPSRAAEFGERMVRRVEEGLDRHLDRRDEQPPEPPAPQTSTPERRPNDSVDAG